MLKNSTNEDKTSMIGQKRATGITDANMNQKNKEQDMNIKDDTNINVNLFKINTLQNEGIKTTYNDFSQEVA